MGTLGEAPPGCWDRLGDHYGMRVFAWLESVPSLLEEAARRWNICLVRYHDAGCASVVALGMDPTGEHVILKAWFERFRFANEVTALQLWGVGLVPRLRGIADDLAIASMNLVAQRPGGAPPPPDDSRAVAYALKRLHAPVRHGMARFPKLDQYLARELLPRVTNRIRDVGSRIPQACLSSGLGALARIQSSSARDVLLHGDLYHENVPFNEYGRPVFIDPLPMVGPAVFDWAFWVVYFDLYRDPRPRLRLASRHGCIPSSVLLPWCLTLCIDGLLYYRTREDPRVERMMEVMEMLADPMVRTRHDDVPHRACSRLECAQE